LLDIERDGDSLLDIACLGTGLRRLGDARASSSRCEISARYAFVVIWTVVASMGLPRLFATSMLTIPGKSSES
jgi:hypothetical protein